VEELFSFVRLFTDRIDLRDEHLVVYYLDECEGISLDVILNLATADIHARYLRHFHAIANHVHRSVIAHVRVKNTSVSRIRSPAVQSFDGIRVQPRDVLYDSSFEGKSSPAFNRVRWKRSRKWYYCEFRLLRTRGAAITEKGRNGLYCL
jgi:hypothetical protein